MKLPFYCPLVDGEHLLSWFTRYHILSGRRNMAASLKAIGTSRGRLKSCEFNSAFAAILEFYQVYFDSNFSIFEHSPLSLWALSHGAKHFDAWKQDHQLPLKPVFEPNKLNVRSNWSFCKSCCEEDRDKLGFSFWHAEHQIPGLVLCPKHSEKLVSDQTGITDLSRATLPHLCVSREHWQLEEWVDDWDCFVLKIFQLLNKDSNLADKLTAQVPNILGLPEFNKPTDNEKLQDHQLRFDAELPKELLQYLFKFYCKEFKRQPTVLRSTLGYKVYDKGKHPVYWLVILYWLKDEINWAAVK